MRIFVIIIVVLAVVAAGTYFFMQARQENVEMSSDIQSQAPGLFIDLPSGRVHYLLQGPESGELMVFIHGGGVTGMEVWKNNVPFFVNQGYRVLSYDLYDRGFSARTDGQNSLDLFENQLVSLLDSLKLLNRPVHFISMSMGSLLALEFLTHRDMQLQRLVLIDPAISGDFRPNFMLRVPVLSDVLMTTYWYPRAVENQRKEFVDMKKFDSYAERLSYFSNFKGYKKSNYSTWMNILNQNRLALLSEIPAHKVLLLYGEQDPYFPSSNVNLLQSHYPTLQYQSIPQAGHMPHYEQPDVVNQLILDFVQSRQD